MSVDFSSSVRSGPLSRTQETLWNLAQTVPGAALNIATAVAFRGPLDPEAFAEAFYRVLTRHEPLRSRYGLVDGELRAMVQPPAHHGFHRYDLERASVGQLSTQLGRLVSWHCSQAFDLERDRPIRSALVRVASDRWAWLMGMHHICTDGWSLMVLCKDLSLLYRGLASGEPCPLAPLDAQCIEVAAWQRRWRAGSEAAAQLEWWRGYLDRPPIAPLELPEVGAASPTLRVPMSLKTRRLPDSLARRLERVRIRERSSTYLLCLSALKLLLSRWCRQQDILVATLMANRIHPLSGSVLGAHYNTVLVRTRLDGDPTARDLLRRVTASCTEVFERQGVPFPDVAAMVESELGLESRSLLRVMFMHDEPPRRHLDLGGVAIHDLDWSEEGLRRLRDEPLPEPAGDRPDLVTRNTMATAAELAFYVREDREHLELWIFYKTDLLPDTTAEWFLDSYLAILDGLIGHLEEESEG